MRSLKDFLNTRTIDSGTFLLRFYKKSFGDSASCLVSCTLFLRVIVNAIILVIDLAWGCCLRDQANHIFVFGVNEAEYLNVDCFFSLAAGRDCYLR